MSQTLAINQLLHFKEQHSKLESEIANWEAEKAVMAKKLANVPGELTPPLGFHDALDKDPKLMNLTRRIDVYTQKIDFIVKSNGGEKIPSVLDMEKKVAELQEEREQFKRDKLAEFMKTQHPLVEKKLKDDVERGATNLALLAAQKKKLEAEIEEYQKQINKNFGTGSAAFDPSIIEVDERTKMLTQMLDKANLLRTEVTAPSRVTDFQRAAVPMKRDLKKQILGTIMAGLMGFGLVGFGVIVTESRVRRTMNLADVRKNVLCPIIGVIPARSGKKGTAHGIGETMEKARTQAAATVRPAGKQGDCRHQQPHRGRQRLPGLAACRKLQPSGHPDFARRLRFANSVASSRIASRKRARRLRRPVRHGSTERRSAAANNDPHFPAGRQVDPRSPARPECGAFGNHVAIAACFNST